MNEIFNFHGQDVRAVTINNEPYFVGKDVAEILGYQNGSRDVNRHVDEEDKLKYRFGTSGQDGMSAKKFNAILHDLGVQYKVNGQWILYKKHMGKGYVDSSTFDYRDKNGQTQVNMTTTWTQKGRLFLYELLKLNGILPIIEQ